MTSLSRKNRGDAFAIFILLLIAIGTLSVIGYGVAWYLSRTETVVTVDKSWIKAASADQAQMYMFSDTEGNVYAITDCLPLWIWDASNRYALLHEGETYTIIAYGWRIPFLSWYPNAVWVIPLENGE